MRRFVLVFVVGGAVATALAGSSLAEVQAPRTAGATTTVNVVMREWSFVLSASSVHTGTVIFKILNDGQIPHNFSIAGRTTPNIRGGGEGSLTVTFPQAGSQRYLCTIGNHASLGMRGTLTVTGSTIAPKPTATLNVSEKEWKIALTTSFGAKVRSVKHGLIRFKVNNVGRLPHDFMIAKSKTRVLKHGTQAVLNVTLKPGTYKYICTVKGHAARGMKGVLVVT